MSWRSCSGAVVGGATTWARVARADSYHLDPTFRTHWRIRAMWLRLLPQAHRWALVTACWADVAVVVELVHRSVGAALALLVWDQSYFYLERSGGVTFPERLRDT